MASRKKELIGRLGITQQHGLLSAVSEMRGMYGDSWRTFSVKPEDVATAQRKSREFEGSVFVQAGLQLKTAFADWGCRFKAVDREDQEELDQWLESDYGSVLEQVTQYKSEVWRDWFLLDSAVSFWRTPARALKVVEEARKQAFTLPPEDCQYVNAFGMEQLRVKLVIPPDTLKEMSDAERLRYGRGEVLLDEGFGEYYRVITRERLGKGFAMPRLRGLLDTLRANESLEVFDNCWGYIARQAIQQVKLGHEIKSGPRAGLPVNFYKEKVAQNIKKLLEGKLGALTYVGNFDQEFLYPFPSLDRFDKKKFEGVYQRMALWLGPIGLLMTGAMKGSEDVLMRMFRAEIRQDRQRVGMHLNQVINRAFRPPVPLEVRWNDKIFMDSRQVMEMVKYLLSAGALSQESGLESVGEDQKEQWAAKDEEAKQLKNDATKHRILPTFDPAHGVSPVTGEGPGTAGAAGAAGGRPAGKKSKTVG